MWRGQKTENKLKLVCYLLKVRLLSGDVREIDVVLVSVHEVGTELWILCVSYIKMIKARHINHLHVSTHERLVLLRRKANVDVKCCFVLVAFLFAAFKIEHQ